MEVLQVLHMNGGMGDTSYAKNSSLQQKVISMTMPMTEEAIINLYDTLFPKILSIADLGCSSGPNTLFAVSEIIKAVEKICGEVGHQSPEYQVFLNDLPGNDFNSIFLSLPSFHAKLQKQMGTAIGPCFFTGVPGSFYGRLFPSNSLHFVHSSYSLMWLSQVPEGLESNRGNIYMASSSPPTVLKAYCNQFQRDFSKFLMCRSEELVAGGRMVLTLLGRRSGDPTSKECCYIWELLSLALNQMVLEGVIDEEKLNSFNIPQYTPSPLELKSEITKEGSFSINRLEISEVNWNGNEDEFEVSEKVVEDKGYNIAKCMRAVAEPLLTAHFEFSNGIIDEIFRRYRTIVADRMSKEKTKFVNLSVSLTKKDETCCYVVK